MKDVSLQVTQKCARFKYNKSLVTRFARILGGEL